MKICLISCIDSIDDSRVSRIRNSLKKIFSQQIVIMTKPFSGNYLEQEAGVHFIELPRVRHFFSSSANIIEFILAIIERLRNSIIAFFQVYKAKPDICHCQEPDSWLISLIIKKIKGCKVVVDFREVYETRANRILGPLQLSANRIISRLMQIFSRYTDLVIHVSENRKKLYPYFQCKSDTVSLYPELSSFDCYAQKKLDNIKLKNKFVIVHAGPLRPSYASNQLLKSLTDVKKILPNLLCVVLGGYLGKDSSDLSYIDDLEESGHLLILPLMTHEETIKYISRSHIGLSLVLPIDLIHRFAFPRKFFEYLAAGIPIIGSDVPDINQVITEWECGLLVNAEHSQEISDAIVKLAKDEKLRNRYGLNARKAAVSKYNWDNEEKKLLKIYNEVISKSAFI